MEMVGAGSADESISAGSADESISAGPADEGIGAPPSVDRAGTAAHAAEEIIAIAEHDGAIDRTGVGDVGDGVGTAVDPAVQRPELVDPPLLAPHAVHSA